MYQVIQTSYANSTAANPSELDSFSVIETTLYSTPDRELARYLCADLRHTEDHYTPYDFSVLNELGVWVPVDEYDVDSFELLEMSDEDYQQYMKEN